MKNYPKIGIRPIIDGRQGGIRESLEEKTMNLAKAVAELISNSLKNGDGTPVECVIADGTIGRVAEAARCAEKFENNGVGPQFPLHHAGAMDQKQWICILIGRKPYGDSTVRSVRELFILLQSLLLMPRRDFLHLVFMDMMCRTWMIIQYQLTLAEKDIALGARRSGCSNHARQVLSVYRKCCYGYCRKYCQR